MVRRSPRTVRRLLEPWLQARRGQRKIPTRHLAPYDRERASFNHAANKTARAVAKQAMYPFGGAQYRGLKWLVFQALKRHLCARRGYTEEELVAYVASLFE